MKPPLYKEALAHSWHLSLKQHGLWPFGLFAAALGQMGIVDALVQLWFTARGYRPGGGFTAIYDLFRAGLVGTDVPYGVLGWMAFLALVFIGFGVLFTFLAVASQGALVHNTAESVRHKKLPDTSQSWHAGVRSFWCVFTVNVLKKAVLGLTGIMVALFSWPILFSLGGSPIVFLLVFLLAAAISLVTSIVAIYSIGYLVVEEYGLLESLVEGWKLFVEHWLVSLEVGVVIFVLDLILTLVFIAAVFVSFLPAFLAYLFALLFSSSIVFVFGIGISAVVLLLFLFFVAAVFSTFTTAAWTYLFMQMHKTGLKSHILHWLGK